MPAVNTVANGPAEPPEAVAAAAAAAAAAPKTKTLPSPSPPAAATKGRGLRRWRRIRRDQERPRDSAGGGGEYSQSHKRLLPLAAAVASMGRHGASSAAEAAEAEAESSTASVESRLVPPPPTPGPGFSVGTCNSEDGSSRSSTAGTAPAPVPLTRRDHASLSAVLSPRERDTPRPRAAASISTGAGCSPSSVESGLRSSNAVKPRQELGAAGLNGVRKVFSGYCGHGDEDRLSREVRSTGRCRGNGSSVVGRSARSNAGEESVGNGGDGRMYWDADPCNESILVLGRAQEALENEIEKIAAIGKEPSDEFNVNDDEWRGSVHLEEPNEDLMVRIKHLESRLEEASALVKEKASRIYELEAIRSRMQPGKTTREGTNLLLSQCELDQLYQERMESEIQCIILTRACQASATLAEDQMTLYQTQRSLSEHYKLLGLKLRHTENRAMVLEEMAEKLQLQCKELSDSSEVLQLRYNASRVSLFCFVQFILLCIATGIYLMRLSASSNKVVPT